MWKYFMNHQFRWTLDLDTFHLIVIIREVLIQRIQGKQLGGFHKLKSCALDSCSDGNLLILSRQADKSLVRQLCTQTYVTHQEECQIRMIQGLDEDIFSISSNFHFKIYFLACSN